MIGQSAGEKFAKMTPRNNVYWSYFRINRIKTLIINRKITGASEIFLNHQRFLSWPTPVKPQLKITLNISWDCPFKGR